MERRRVLIYLLICSFLIINIIACSPTYLKDEIVESVVKMCKSDYNLDVEVKVIGETLGAFVVLDNLIEENLMFNEETSIKIDAVLLSITRVCLSTNAPLKFYVVVCRDSIAGVEVSFIRYIDDIKKFMSGFISRDDYFNRLVMDVKPEILWDNKQFSLSEIQMPDFLSFQMEQRLRTEINQKNLYVSNFYIKASRKEEDYNKGVAFKCRLEPEGNIDIKEYMWDEFLELLLETVYNVCRKYDFSNYLSLKLLAEDGEEILTVEKPVLREYLKERKKWVFK